jgi:hypothetical protein
VTKTERKKRAREIRKQLGLFVDIQDQHIRDYVRDELHQDPAERQMQHLYLSRRKLNALITAMEAEGGCYES